MIKYEYKRFWSRKYLLFLIPVLIFVCISLFFNFTQTTEDYGKTSVYSNFSSLVEFYETREQLETIYNECVVKYNFQSDGAWVEGGNKKTLKRQIQAMKYCLDNNLSYDDITDISSVQTKTKYTSFHFIYDFYISFLLFSLISTVLVGSCYQTSDVMTKISKLVYTDGEKRFSIISRKYLVSLSMLLAVAFVINFVFFVLGLQFANYAKYLVFFVGEYVVGLSYFEFWLFILFSQLLMIFFTYTFIYFFAVSVKNAIIALCTFFVLFAISMLTVGMTGDMLKFKEFLQGGYAQFFSTYDYNAKYILFYIPLALANAIMMIIAFFVSKRADYSR